MLPSIPPPCFLRGNFQIKRVKGSVQPPSSPTKLQVGGGWFMQELDESWGDPQALK